MTGALWLGVTLLTVGVVVSAFKGWVVWDVTHDVFNGGGVPTLDFALFCPAPVAVGLTVVLKVLGLYPFPWFGLAAYLGLAAGFGGLHWWFDRLGEPERRRQLEAIQLRSTPGAHGGPGEG